MSPYLVLLSHSILVLLLLPADVKLPDFSKGGHEKSRSMKGAPLESLFAQFCLSSLWFGNCNIRGKFVV